MAQSEISKHAGSTGLASGPDGMPIGNCQPNSTIFAAPFAQEVIMKAMLIILLMLMASMLYGGDIAGDWIDADDSVVCDTPLTIDTGYTGVTSLLDLELFRYQYAYKVDTVFTGDSLIVTWQVCDYTDFSSGPLYVLWTDTLTDMATSWTWSGSDRELKEDSTSWHGYFRAQLIYFFDNADTLFIDEAHHYYLKTSAFLEVDD